MSTASIQSLFVRLGDIVSTFDGHFAVATAHCGQHERAVHQIHSIGAGHMERLEARLRLVRLYEATGNAGLVCRRCGISRPTLRKW
jgi:hypothetical protein